LAFAGPFAAAGPMVLSIFLACPVRAEDPPRTIEVASIHPATFPSEEFFTGFALAAGGVCSSNASMRPAISGNRMSLYKMPLCQLISTAYDVPGYRIAGVPAWMLKMERSNYYDVQIKAEGESALSQDQARGLLRVLIGDRFQLRLHHDLKTLPVYDLMVGKNGAKLKEVPLEGRPQRNGVSITTYIILISNYLDRPLVDKTGMTGAHYQYHWDEKELREQIAQGGKPAPSIFSAVEEQLGLTLKAANEGIDVLEIDHAEKPSEN
jgi:uncharacterized protein (TIGR03435 family)